MSDYAKSTNFASKDSLSSGDPLKIVKGTEFDTEFNNIAVAVATKADIASPTLTGTPAAPTASSGTNTTQIATTAFVTTALRALYPVGSIYINAGVSTNPGTLLGFGTWTAFGAGRVMVGLNGSDSSFDTLEETGGSKDASVVSHTHTGTTASNGSATGTLVTGVGNFGDFQDASGVFSLSGPETGRSQGASDTGSFSTATLSISNHTHTFTTGSTGSSGTNANLQPYITVAMWKRTA
jgi:hypothetical protein